MEVKTMSVLLDPSQLSLKKKKKKSKLKKCTWIILQTHTGNVHKGLKPRLLPTGPYSA